MLVTVVPVEIVSETEEVMKVVPCRSGCVVLPLMERKMSRLVGGSGAFNL